MHIPDQRLNRALMDARLYDAQHSKPVRSGAAAIRGWTQIRDWWHSVVDQKTHRPTPERPERTRGEPRTGGPVISGKGSG